MASPEWPHAAVGEDQLSAEHMVRRHSVAARQLAHAAAEHRRPRHAVDDEEKARLADVPPPAPPVAVAVAPPAATDFEALD